MTFHPRPRSSGKIQGHSEAAKFSQPRRLT
jgi:hypothetical protein